LRESTEALIRILVYQGDFSQANQYCNSYLSLGFAKFLDGSSIAAIQRRIEAKRNPFKDPSAAASRQQIQAQQKFSEYLTKLINPQEDVPGQSLQASAGQSAWINKIEESLEQSGIRAFDADFLFTVDGDGNISKLSLLETRSLDFDAFKNFVADFIKWRMPITEGTNTGLFKLNAAHFCIQPVTAFSNNNLMKNFKNSPLKVKLLSPPYVDFPSIGEELSFQIAEEPEIQGVDSRTLLNGASFTAIVINLDRDLMQVHSTQIKLANGQKVYCPMSWIIKRQEPSGGRLLDRLMNSVSSSVAQSGITASVVSYGMLPAALGAAGILSGVIDDFTERYSFNLTQGDLITILGDLRG
jgi:hypothetical protein